MKHFVGATILFVLVLNTSDSGSPKPRREDVPKYLKMLTKSPVAKERMQGAQMLGRRGAINVRDVKDAIEPLKKALEKDSDMEVRRAAAEALGRIAPEPETTVPLLIDSLKVKHYGLRMASVQALAAYGPKAKDALPALAALRKELNNKGDNKTIAAAMQSISSRPKK